MRSLPIEQLGERGLNGRWRVFAKPMGDKRAIGPPLSFLGRSLRFLFREIQIAIQVRGRETMEPAASRV
jgi:hypothetical protein